MLQMRGKKRRIFFFLPSVFSKCEKWLKDNFRNKKVAVKAC